MSEPTVGFCGMSHLGLVSAIVAAAQGVRCVAYDPDPVRIAALASGTLPIFEPGLDALRAAHVDRLRWTADLADLVRCDLAYIAADAPTDADGQVDMAVIDHLFDTVPAALDPAAPLVLLSQVSPGYTRTKARPGLPLFYQVETLIFGLAVERALKPERYILGAAAPDTGLPAVLEAFLARFDCPRLVMRYESAELAKIAINCFLVSSVGTTNMLAELCEAIDADWSQIAPALRLDRRIGPHAYLSPGLGLAGGNLERDLATVLHLAAGHGTDAGQVEAWLANSRRRRRWVLDQLRHPELGSRPGSTVAVLGLAYKPETHSTRNSPALALIEALADRRVQAFDPVVRALDPPLGWVTLAGSALDACRNADAVAIMTAWPEFARIAPADLARAMAGRAVVDPWSVLDAAACAAAGLRHLRLGCGAAPTAA